jgi:hypothetical protein
VKRAALGSPPPRTRTITTRTANVLATNSNAKGIAMLRRSTVTPLRPSAPEPPRRRTRVPQPSQAMTSRGRGQSRPPDRRRHQRHRERPARRIDREQRADSSCAAAATQPKPPSRTRRQLLFLERRAGRAGSVRVRERGTRRSHRP